MGGKCDGGPAGGPGRNRYTVQRSIRWLSRTDVMWGPRFSSTAPGRIPPLLASIVSVWVGHSVETSAEPTCDGCGRNFSIVARRQVPPVRKRRTEGNAVATRRVARAGIGTQYNASKMRPPLVSCPQRVLQDGLGAKITSLS
jgi:hypothetical protein